jgi:hypothetical protein
MKLPIRRNLPTDRWRRKERTKCVDDAEKIVQLSNSVGQKWEITVQNQRPFLPCVDQHVLGQYNEINGSRCPRPLTHWYASPIKIAKLTNLAGAADRHPA